MSRKKNKSLINCYLVQQDETFLQETLKPALHQHFQTITINTQYKSSLEALLLQNSNTSVWSIFNFQKAVSYTKRGLISHVLTASAAIALTFFVSKHFSNVPQLGAPHDAVSEVASLSGNLEFPADFNLDGNLNDLPSFIEDALPNHSFSPSVPKQLAANFAAYEGRFFLFKGDQGVGVNISPAQPQNKFTLSFPNGQQDKLASMLYIVKLSDKNKLSFPSHKTSHRILASSGHFKKVFAWIEGAYGYAMVQNATDNDTTDSLSNPLH